MQALQVLQVRQVPGARQDQMVLPDKATLDLRDLRDPRVPLVLPVKQA